MTSGDCLDCGATWSSKCHKCRNVFWDETTHKQLECQHPHVHVTSQPEKCIYSGCKYEPIKATVFVLLDFENQICGVFKTVDAAFEDAKKTEASLLKPQTGATLNKCDKGEWFVEFTPPKYCYVIIEHEVN